MNMSESTKLNPKLAMRIVKNLMILAPILIKFDDTIKISFMKDHIQAQTELTFYTFPALIWREMSGLLQNGYKHGKLS